MTLVNSEQSNIDRKSKYHLARMFGYNVEQAMRMRDWRKKVFVKVIFYDKIREEQTK